VPTAHLHFIWPLVGNNPNLVPSMIQSQSNLFTFLVSIMGNAHAVVTLSARMYWIEDGKYCNRCTRKVEKIYEKMKRTKKEKNEKVLHQRCAVLRAKDASIHQLLE